MSEAYHDKAASIFRKMFATQKDNIIAACAYGLQSVTAGGSFYAFGTGHSHMMAEELYARLKGTDYVTPIILPELMLHQFPSKSTAIERLPSYAGIIMEMYPFSKGDTIMLVSNSGRNGMLVELAFQAKQAGMQVIACVNHEQAKVIPSRHPSGKNIIDFADVIIDNCGDFGDACYEVSEGMKMGSTSNMVTLTIAQMMNAAMIALTEKIDPRQTLERFEAYFWQCFDRTVEQQPILEQSAAQIVAAIRNQQRFYVYGGGHSHMVSEELYTRAGGLTCVTPILEDEIMVHQSGDKSALMETSAEYAHILMRKYGLQAGDVLLVVSNSGTGKLSVELALTARTMGVQVIALTNVRQAEGAVSRHPSKQRLLDVADLVIDNGCQKGDAAFSVGTRECCPLSSPLACYLVQEMMIDVALAMKKAGMIPPILLSANVDVDSDRQEVLKRYSIEAKTNYRDWLIYQGPRLARFTKK